MDFKRDWTPFALQAEVEHFGVVRIATAHNRLRSEVATARRAGLEEGVERVQAQIDAAVERERGRVIGIFVGELQKLHEKTVLDCGDNSCLFATRRGGMRTNGGCRCIERLLDAAVAREREQLVEGLRMGQRIVCDALGTASKDAQQILVEFEENIRARTKG